MRREPKDVIFFLPACLISSLFNVNVELQHERRIIAKTDIPTVGTIMDLREFNSLMIFSR